MTAAKKDKQEDQSIEILIRGTCKTVTSKSNLSYQVGRNDKADIFIRIYSNTNSGAFSDEWIALKVILLTSENQGGSSFTSYVFKPLFEGLSANGPAFICAILIDLKILQFEEGQQRKYVFNSPAALLAKLDKPKPTKKPTKKPK